MVMWLIRTVDYYMGIPLCFILGTLGRFLGIFKKGDYPGEPNKILLMKTWGLGNIILMLPAMKAIRERFPRAQIYFFSLKNNEQILENNPYINGYFLLDMGAPGIFLASIIRNLRLLRRKGIDCILDFDQFARFTALLSFFIGKKNIGFDTKGQGKRFIFRDSVVYNNTQHMSRTFYDLARAIGVAEEDYRIVKVAYTEDELSSVQRFLKEHRVDTKRDILIGMHIGCGSNFPSRCWPLENFAQLADRLIEGFKAKIYFSGTKEEAGLIQKAMGLMKNPAINACARFTIKELSVLIEESDLFFSNDTAPLHIASAMGTPVVGFFGPNTPLLYGPLGENNVVFYKGLPCSPCITNYNAKSSDCRNPVCINSIKVDEVYKEAVEKILVDSPKR